MTAARVAASCSSLRLRRRHRSGSLIEAEAAALLLQHEMPTDGRDGSNSPDSRFRRDVCYSPIAARQQIWDDAREVPKGEIGIAEGDLRERQLGDRQSIILRSD
jgi:hypothetical protein